MKIEQKTEDREIVHTEIYNYEYPPVEVYTFKNGAQVLRVGNELTELDGGNGYNASVNRIIAATRKNNVRMTEPPITLT